MAVNVKMGVDLSGFTAGIREGQGILKGLNAEMKATEAEFKATGNAEQMLAAKTKTLTSQLNIQKGIADQASKALKAMADAGVDPASAAYQKMYATMMNATAGMNSAQAELNALAAGTQSAAAGADKLSSSMQNIGKKISLEQVISGIDSITSGLEKAAQKAAQLGKDLWNNIMDSAMLADDIATQARVFDMTPEQYQAYKGVFDTIGEVTMQEWASVRRKVEKAMEDPSNDQIDILKALGFGEVGTNPKYGGHTEDIKLAADNWEDAFWNVATEIKRRVDNGQISLATADVWGEAFFGKKYSNLKTLIDLGPEAFAAALKDQNVASQEAVEKDAALNDEMIKLKGSFDALKLEVTSALAPALTDAATALDGLLGSLLEYLQKPEGQEMLDKLGTAVSGLFEDLSKIDPQDVIEGFTGVFTTIVDGLQWISDNSGAVVSALEGIVIGWGALKLTGGALEIVKLINGLASLTGGGAAAAAGQAGAAAGASWAAGFSNAVATTAPALAGMLGITAIALTPALIAQAQDNQRWQTQYNERAAAAALGNKNAWFINQANEAFGMTGQTQFDTVDALLMGLASRQNQQKAELYNLLSGRFTSEAGNTWNALNAFWGGAEMDQVQVNALLQDITDAMAAADSKPQVTIEPVVSGDAAAMISAQIGVVPISVAPSVASGIAGLVSGIFGMFPGFANGINYVPYDGMLARLHKGERVMPAREVQSRNYSSNLYVESMIMNNGTDANGLASAMAAAQRRTMAGYGS